MFDTLNGYHIQFEPGTDNHAAPLLLLHGTGGDESSLMPLGRAMVPTAPLLGVRGSQMEGTITRWFKRFGEGRFDLDDAALQADRLASLVEIAVAKLGFSSMPVAVGYSNGANIASAVLMRHPHVFDSAVLMRGMNTVPPVPGLDLGGKRILYLNGASDPLAPPDSRAIMVGTMRAAGAEVTEKITGPGHDIGMEDAVAAQSWLSLPAAKVA